MLRVAVVGCGKAGENHVREIGSLPEAQLVAVCDEEPIIAKQLAARYGIPASYDDIERMMAVERPHVVHVATPPQSHLRLSLLALDLGAHVLVEKPFTVDYPSAEALLQHARRQQRYVTVGHGYFFDPICRSMRRLLAEGAIGETVHVESFLGYSLDGQFGVPVFADSGHWVHALRGKLLHNVIDHLLNKVTDFVHSDHPMLTVHAWQRRERDNPAFSMADEVRIMLSDQRVSAYATFSAHARPIGHHLTVYGTRNTIRLDFSAGSLTFHSASSLPGFAGRIASSVDQSLQHLRASGASVGRILRGEFQYMSGLRELFARFYASIRDGTPPPISDRDILRISALTDRVFTQCDAQLRETA